MGDKRMSEQRQNIIYHLQKLVKEQDGELEIILDRINEHYRRIEDLKKQYSLEMAHKCALLDKLGNTYNMILDDNNEWTARL
jgi:hypothetical protein